MIFGTVLLSQDGRSEGGIIPPEGVEQGKGHGHESQKEGPVPGMGSPKTGMFPERPFLGGGQAGAFHGGMISRGF